MISKSIFTALRSRLAPLLLAIFFSIFTITAYRRLYPPPPKPASIVPETRPRTEEGLARFVKEEPRDAHILLLGDSITERWRNDGLEAWKNSELSSMVIANAGVGGDRTQHVLWRLDHGLLDAVHHPHLVVLLIGTNNLIQDTPEDILLGIKAIVNRLWRRFARAQIVVCSVPPWVPNSDQDFVAARKTRPLNDMIEQWITLLSDRRLVWWDWSAQLRNDDGLGKKELFKDRVHLSAEGYAMWATSLVATIKKYM